MNAVRTLGQLLQGELSAVEAYRRALHRPEARPLLRRLRRIERDHEDAVIRLESRIRALGGEPPRSSGVWGRWAEGVEGTAPVVGHLADFKALLQEEEHSLSRYQDALRDGGLDEESAELIRETLLIQVKEHLPDVRALMRRAAEVREVEP